MTCRLPLLCGAACAFVWIASVPAPAASTLSPGFTETLVAGGLSNPTAMAIAPDGRVFVCQQGGQLRVVKDGALLAAPFVTLTVNSLTLPAGTYFLIVKADATSAIAEAREINNTQKVKKSS